MIKVYIQHNYYYLMLIMLGDTKVTQKTKKQDLTIQNRSKTQTKTLKKPQNA